MKSKMIRNFDGWAMRLKSSRKDGTQLYYCVDRNRRAKCLAAYSFDPANNTFSVTVPHSRHDKNYVRADSFLMRQELKNKANDGTPREVIDEVRAQHSANTSIASGSYTAKRCMIYRAKEKESSETKEMNKGGAVAPEFESTTSGEPFLLADEVHAGTRILMFASDMCLDMLANSTIILVDGTFDVAPEGFTQLFSIHAYIATNVIRPLIYCLLGDKKGTTYQRVLQVLKMQPCLANWKPTLVLCDFECAIKNAFVAEYPNVSVEGCLFHLTQSWRREAKKLELYAEFTNGSIVDFWSRLKSLAFVPTDVLETLYNEILASLPANVPAELNDFLLYIERNYVTATSRFPPSMWSCHLRTINCIHRTTNCLEVWHRTVSKVVATKNGMATVQLSDVIKTLRLEDRHTRLDAAELLVNPNFSVNKNRMISNLLKDRRLLKAVENSPHPPSPPLGGIDLLDAIAYASDF